MKISYAITVCNELDEITKLLNFLQLNIRKEDEIVIQYDESSVTSEVKEYISLMDMMHENHNVIGFPLNKDFASFKNNLKSNCSGDYIFQIDADEIPHAALIEYLPEVLTTNPVDIVFVPRVNTVEGLTDEHIKKWNWKVDEKGWVRYSNAEYGIIVPTQKISLPSIPSRNCARCAGDFLQDPTVPYCSEKGALVGKVTFPSNI